eukprot:4045304-Pyramimonas_sp.AAC.1
MIFCATKQPCDAQVPSVRAERLGADILMCFLNFSCLAILSSLFLACCFSRARAWVGLGCFSRGPSRPLCVANVLAAIRFPSGG